MATKTETQEFTLYNGTVPIVFYPNSHRYKLGTENLISVTTATSKLDKPALIKWAVGKAKDYLLDMIERGETITAEAVCLAALEHEKAKNKAAGFGDLVHEFAEKFALAKIGQSPMPTIDQEWPVEVINGVNAFLDWVATHRVVFVSAETVVYSKEHRYVGKCDALAEVDGRMTVIDYKTSNGVYDEHHYQVAAYWSAIQEEQNIEIERQVIIRFGKDTGEFEAHEIDGEDMRLNFEAFLHCLALKRRERELSAKK